MQILIVNFSLEGITEDDYRSLAAEVAPAFAAVPGLISKVWLADRLAGVYGGVYTFDNMASLDAFMASELFAGVGATPGLANITVHRFEVLAEPTAVTRGVVTAVA